MKEERRRPSVRALLLLCVVLLGLGGWLLLQRNQAWDREQRQKELMLVDFSVQVTDAGAYAYWVAKDITDFTFGDCLASLTRQRKRPSAWGMRGCCPKRTPGSIRRISNRWARRCGKAAKRRSRQRIWKMLMVIDRQEAFWADGAPYDDFAAYMAK